MDYERTLFKSAKLIILFAIIYFIWTTVIFGYMRTLLAGPKPQVPPPPVWWSSLNKTYWDYHLKLETEANKSLDNGTQLYLQDCNASILVAVNGTVYANISWYTNNSYVTFMDIYNRVSWKFACINSMLLHETICNDRYSDFSQQYIEGISKTMSMDLASQEQQSVTFAIPMNINGHGGTVYSYDYTYNPTDDYLYNLLNTNPTSILNITSEYETANAVIAFNENSVKCLRFMVPRFGRTRVNVTTLNPIINYTIPPAYLNKSIVGSNYVYVDYNPSPCCGIPRPDKIEVEVCA